MSDFTPIEWGAVVCAVILLCCAAVPGLIAPHGPLTVDPAHAFQPPSLTHPFGTDDSGRDVLSRVVFGARDSLTIGVVATILGLAGGLILGILAGGSRSLWLAPIRFLADRIIEALFSFPGMLLALLLIAVRGPGLSTIIIAVAISNAPGYARLIRGGLRRNLSTDPVEAAQIQGDSWLRIWVRLILPESLRPVVVLAMLGIGQAVVLAAGLGFLGLGAPPPAPEWGAMLNAGRAYLTRAWWLTFFPGLAITLVGICTAVIGRALERRGRWA